MEAGCQQRTLFPLLFPTVILPQQEDWATLGVACSGRRRQADTVAWGQMEGLVWAESGSTPEFGSVGMMVGEN